MSRSAGADGVEVGQAGGGNAGERRRAGGPPGRGALVVVGATVAVALGIDGLAMVWAAATFLDPQCGEDVAWLGLVAAGAVASTASFGAAVVVALTWWRGRPLRNPRRAARALVAVIGASAALATVAALWFPDGSCP